MAKEIRDLELKAKTKAEVGSRILDGEGLVGTVRIDRSDRVVVGFEFRFRSPTTGKVRNVSCGTWPTSTLKEIRSVRDKFRLMIKDGIDPVEAKRVDKLAAKAEQAEAILRQKERLVAVAAAHARMTVEQLFERWEKTELVERADKGVEARRMFVKDVFPHIGAMAAEDVRKGHVMAIVDNIKQRGVPRMARVVFSHIRQMMRFAVDRDFIENEPTAAIRKEKAVGKDEERDRFLDEDEIRLLSEKLPQSGLSNQVQAAVWIMLSTLARVGEISKARWINVDLGNRKWRIPPEDAKNDKEFIITLSDFAVRHFETLRQLSTSATWVLPSRDGQSHLDEKTITKQIRDRQRTEKLKGRAKPSCVLVLPAGDWTSHDLRRSGATLMGELGIDDNTIERCLNHIEQNKMKRTYQRQRAEPAMIEAWMVLGQHLELLTNSTGNVIPLKRACPST